jgi:pimeloyl-ACP methyl ester carboxylesterase
MYSRPGYGDSNTAIGRQVATAAQDTALIVTALGHDGFVTAGWSGGGPHALACAALIDGCKAAGVIAGPAPRDAEGLDWLAGMAQDNLDEFDLAGLGGEEFDAFLETVASSVPLLTNASDIAGALGDLLTARDVEAVGAHGIGEYLLAAIQGAVRVGTTGWRDDDVALLTPWGTNPSDISKPVLIWHGTEDRMVPYSHAEWLVSHIPGAVLKRADGEGHLSVASEAVPDIVAFLAGAAGL